MNEQQFPKNIGFIWSNGINLYWSLVGTLEEILAMELDPSKMEERHLMAYLQYKRWFIHYIICHELLFAIALFLL